MAVMRALWLENQVFSFRDDLPVPQPGTGEALVKVRLAGICATDLEMGRGYYPFTGVPGHEFVGEVSSAPESPDWMGARVVGEINVTCGECRACRAGRPHHCERRTVLGILNHDGAFSEYLALPVKNLHRVPEGLPDEKAVFTEPLAAALEILEQVHIRPDERWLVVGAGRLGLLVAQVLALTGCELRVVARHPNQRAILSQLGIHPIGEQDVSSQDFDGVVEATGNPDGFALARRAVRPAGTLVMKSTYKGDLTVNFSSMVVDEIRLIGSRCGPFEPALRLLERGMVNPLPLISGEYGLKEGLQAIEHAMQRGALKVLLRP